MSKSFWATFIDIWQFFWSHLLAGCCNLSCNKKMQKFLIRKISCATSLNFHAMTFSASETQKMFCRTSDVKSGLSKFNSLFNHLITSIVHLKCQPLPFGCHHQAILSYVLIQLIVVFCSGLPARICLSILKKARFWLGIIEQDKSIKLFVKIFRQLLQVLFLHSN